MWGVLRHRAWLFGSISDADSALAQPAADSDLPSTPIRVAMETGPGSVRLAEIRVCAAAAFARAKRLAGDP